MINHVCIPLTLTRSYNLTHQLVYHLMDIEPCLRTLLSMQRKRGENTRVSVSPSTSSVSYLLAPLFVAHTIIFLPGLDIGGIGETCELHANLTSNLSGIVQITLVGRHDHRYILRLLGLPNLVPEHRQLIKRPHRRDRIHTNKPIPRPGKRRWKKEKKKV